jgi:hypothetical protein
MGTAYFFSFWNPTGHYSLNLAKRVEREVAMTILVLNKEAGKRITAGEKVDRSKYGNKSCFRNESLNGMTITIDNEWILPKNGTVEWDFVYLVDRPSSENAIT